MACFKCVLISVWELVVLLDIGMKQKLSNEYWLYSPAAENINCLRLYRISITPAQSSARLTINIGDPGCCVPLV